MELVKSGKYFTINRPRQYGKSTTLHFLTKNLQKSQSYLSIRLSFEDVSDRSHASDDAFLKFLAMLRTKYLERFTPEHKTFHSIVLAGVHDIKSLKYKLRNPEDAKYNSPWNIAVDFKVDTSFNKTEIVPMLEAYVEAEGVKMDIPVIADRLYYHTAGYPFLVSRLCKITAEDILPQTNKKAWTLDDVEESVQILLNENNTNFDSLIKNLENHQDLYDLVFRIIIEGDEVGFNPDNSVIQKGILYGVFKRNGKIKIHNRIYEQRIYNYLASNMEVKNRASDYNFSHQFYLPNNQLPRKTNTK